MTKKEATINWVCGDAQHLQGARLYRSGRLYIRGDAMLIMQASDTRRVGLGYNKQLNAIILAFDITEGPRTRTLSAIANDSGGACIECKRLFTILEIPLPSYEKDKIVTDCKVTVDPNNGSRLLVYLPESNDAK